jgi:predicted peroxiredoxin
MYERARDAGVSLFVSETWMELLGIEKEKVPPQFGIISMEDIVNLIKESDLIIGKI